MIKISFFGDLMLGRDYDYSGASYHSGASYENTFNWRLKDLELDNSKKYFNDNSMESLFGTCYDKLKDSDLIVGNLETSITRSNKKKPKTFNYRFDPKYVKALKINKDKETFFNNANNHILDYEVQGLIDTLKYLDSIGIKHAGAGININEAMKESVFVIKDKKIVIIGCSDHYEDWEATNSKAGIFLVDYNNYDHVLKFIKTLKQIHNPDLFIMSIHWGPNYIRGIETKYEKYANDIINSGIDIVHGHSAHHIKCLKVFKNRFGKDKLIIFGNGDFLDDYAINPIYRNDIGLIVNVYLNKDNSFDVKYIPTIIKDQQVNILTNEIDKNVVDYIIKNDCSK